MTDLTEHLLADGPDLEQPEQRERWRIDGDNTATWALRKLAAIQAERDRIKLLHQAEVSRLDAWAADADRALSHDADFFTARLTEYRLELEQANPDLPKTYKLPAGSLARRAGRESTYIGDEAEFIAWATVNCPDALRVTAKVAPLAKWERTTTDGEVRVVSPDGELVPGVRIIRGDDRIEVRAADLTEQGPV